ncbi:MAG: right-handed parallel beta-helix repeat-containing protein [Clostridia bacterium]|nr:right-handed parallel beta-helix repeat-containing protein [Clostridia bacterium]
MAKIIAFFTSIITCITMIFTPAAPVEGIFEQQEKTVQVAFDEGEFVYGTYDIVVAPYGDDSNDGTPENPIKTPERAKEMLKNIQTDETVTVWFREGTYYITDTIEFTSDDKSNVIYRSYPDETVEFSGAKEIAGWSETVINGVDAFVTDIEINSDEDYFRSLFKGNKRLSRSQYPKEGVFTIADTCADEAVSSDWAPEYFTHSLAFCANTDEILDFANAGDVEVKIMHYWCDEHLPVSSVDAKTGRIETTKPSSMTVNEGDNFVYENVKEALSLPGEWYLDRSEEKLYYIPEDGDTVDNTVLYAGMTEQLFTFENAENIAFQGINFINTDWKQVDGTYYANIFDESHPLYSNIEYGGVHPQAAFEVPAAIYIEASSGIDFTDCLFENISNTAVKFDNGSKDCNITSCKFNEIGANAIFIHGDFVVPATTKNINVTDCHISYYGRIFNNAIGILLTHAVDCELSNNEIHDGWYTGISVGWNWGYSDNSTNGIKIQNNLIYNIGNGWLSDMGGIYTLGIQPDTVISGNIIHNVGCYEGSTGYGGWGIYLDEGSSYITVEKNLVYDCSSNCFHQHYGENNMVRNNIFAFGDDGQFLITRNEDHNSLYLYNNILVGEKSVMYKNATSKDWFIDNNNLYWDYGTVGNLVYSGNSMTVGDRFSLVIMTLRGYYNNAVYADPLFRDAENRDFTLATNSPALDTGFEPWEYNAGTITKF